MEFLEHIGLIDLYTGVIGYLIIFIKWAPFWVPLVLLAYLWGLWMHYVQAKWQTEVKWIMLELKLPKETHKGPLAMELVLNALYQTGSGIWYDKKVKGRVKDRFSLEMVSLEGQVKFFIRTPAVHKNVIEAQLYAQYPDIEIFEVPDYTRYVDYRGREGDWSCVGMDFGLGKEDAYPIKTYIDYGLDKEGVDEEYKIDPLSSVIEYLGSVGKGEQVWIQIIVQAATKAHHYPHKKDGSMGDWKSEGEALVDKLTQRKEERDEEGKGGPRTQHMTKGEQEIVAAIERNISKFGFECGVRALYVCKRDRFNPSNLKAIGGLWRGFSTANLNEFKSTIQTFGVDAWWQDYKDVRITSYRKAQFEAFKRREFSFEDQVRWVANIPSASPMVITPFKHPFVLSSEELATIFHLPGGVVQTPTFGRLSSRKSEAPTNLPI